MNPVPWLQMTNMISYQGLVRTFLSDIGSNTFLLQNDTFYQLRIKPNALELIKEYVNNGGGLLDWPPESPDNQYHLNK